MKKETCEAGKKVKIFRRLYDGKDWGEGEPNEFLGEFEIIKTINEDFYSGKWIGIKDGKQYLIIQTEVSGMYNPLNGGSSFEINEI